MRNASARENHPTRKRLDAAGSSEEKWGLFVVYRQLETVIFLSHLGCWLACVASVLERFRSKERRRRVKDRAKNGASKRSSPSFIFWLLSIFPTAKTENLVPRRSSVFLCSKPHGNAWYAGYLPVLYIYFNISCLTVFSERFKITHCLRVDISSYF